MTATLPLPDRLVEDAVAALRRGDSAAARIALDALRGSPDQTDIPWLLVGQIELELGNDAGADSALTRHLERAPRDLLALLLLGAIRARRGDDRSATIFYRAALNMAGQPGTSPDPATVTKLRSAQEFLAQASRRFSAHLEMAVNDAGLSVGQGGARVRAALDLLLGRTELYLQQPSMFYFPGLPQRPYYEREEFPWLAAVEAAVPEMRAELEALLATGQGFDPYVQRTPDQPPPANPLLDDPSWGARYLWRSGERAEPTASRCPATMAALALAPIPVITGRSPMALFSLLRPGTHIEPHHGLLNTRLICHVPLIAPPGCGLRVGAETREWQPGQALIFDDSFEHEAWNRGTSVRVVLLFEIWRPEITLDERAALTEIFSAIDTYQGIAVDSG